MGANRHTIQSRMQAASTLDYTCSSTASISAGDILRLVDPATAVSDTASGSGASAAARLAGIAAADKKSSDGATKIAAWKFGVKMRGTASGAIQLGSPIVSASGTPAADNTSDPYANVVRQANSRSGHQESGAQILGYSEEAVADGETFDYILNVGGGTR